MKKKTIFKLLAIMSMIALVGCGKNNTSTTTNESITMENVVTEDIVDNTTNEDIVDNTTEENTTEHSYSNSTENLDGFDILNLCDYEDGWWDKNNRKPFSHTIIDVFQSSEHNTCWAIDEEGTIYCCKFAFGAEDLVFIPKVFNSGLVDLLFVEEGYGRIVAIDSQNNYFVSEYTKEEDVSDYIQYEAYKQGTFNFNIQPISCYLDYDDEKHDVVLDAINLDTKEYYDLSTNYRGISSSDVPKYDDGNWVDSGRSAEQYLEGHIAQELESWVLSDDGTLYGHQNGHTLMEEEPFEYTKDIKFTKLVVPNVSTGLYYTNFAVAEDGTVYILKYYDDDKEDNQMIVATISGLEGEFEFGVHTMPRMTQYLIIKTTEGVYKTEINYDNPEIENITIEKSEECTNANLVKCFSNNCFLTSDGKIVRLNK